MATAIRRVTIRGRVQGVGYRAWVEHQAVRLGLDGWVRNRRDGSVEALFAGAEDAVAEVMARCRRGPSAAHVDDVTVEQAQSDDLNLRRAGKGFSVLPTL
jgi:acylphosphatase